MAKFVVTIDGPLASGKTSVSRGLAQRLGCRWVSTGAFYRGMAYVAREKQVNLANEPELVDMVKKPGWEVKMEPEQTRFVFQGEDVTDNIYAEEVGQVASQISGYSDFRAALLQAQRDCANISEGLVAEGRDCGTVVFPQAEVKIYLTARSEDRARRRALEEGLSEKASQEAQQKRDEQDSTRKAAPLQIPENAEVVDTSTLDLEQVIDRVESIVREKLEF